MHHIPNFDIARLPERLILPDSYLDSGYALETHPRGVALYSRKVNRILRERAGRILLARNPVPFVLSDDTTGTLLQAATEGSPHLYNDRKVRLLSDLLLPELAVPGAVLAVQETDYFSSLCTNDAALRENVVSTLRRSSCSNHIGVSTLGITGEGRILVRKQPAGSAQSAGLIAPSGSGSADAADLGEGRRLGDFLVRSMERELREECGIAGDVALRTRIIGFARLLHRGGKPEFFGVTVVGGLDTTVGIAKNEIGKIREECGDTLSLQMHLSLKFLEDYMKTARPPARGAFRA